MSVSPENYKPCFVSTDEILIAGEDYECDQHDPLRDAKSEVREALDDKWLDLLRQKGFIDTVKCVWKVIPDIDPDVAQLVVVDGRRYLRHCRAINEERASNDLEQMSVRVEIKPAGVKGVQAFELARLANFPVLPETDAQRVEYVQRMDTFGGFTDEYLCNLLQVDPKKLKVYRKVGSGTVDPLIHKCLDRGLLSISGAALLVTQDLSVQRETCDRLEKKAANKNKAPTVDELKKEISKAGGAKYSTSPGKKLLKKAVKLNESIEDNSMKLHPQSVNVLRWACGDLELDEFPEMSAIFETE